MKKIERFGTFMELSSGKDIVSIDIDSICTITRSENGTELGLIDGSVVEVDQSYDDIVDAIEEDAYEND